MKTSIVIAVVIALSAAAAWTIWRGRVGSPRANKATSQADAGKRLRLMALTTPADKCGFRSDADYPKVYGVIADWTHGDLTASILAMRGGTASLYTTSSFGIIGGEGHAKVRRAADACVKVAGQYYDQGIPAADFAYPKEGKVYFYLLCYEGVRLCVGEEAALKEGTDPMLPLFSAAQDVLTELRLASEGVLK